MKNTYKFLGIIAAASAMSLVSCQKQEFQPNPEGTTITVNATVEDPIVTKTYVEELENAYAINWSESELNMQAFVWNESGYNKAESNEFTSNPDGTGTFNVTVPSGEWTNIAGIYPSSAVKETTGDTQTRMRTELPTIQNPSATSYDPAAYILIARPTALPESLEGFTWEAYYYRATALNKFMVTNLENGGNIVSAKITFPEGEKVSGYKRVNLTTAEVIEYSANNPNYVDLNYKAAPLAANEGGSYDLWFTTWTVNVPMESTGFTVEVTTEEYKYTKTFIPKQDGFVLEENAINIVPVNMTGAEVETIETDDNIIYSNTFAIGEGDFTIDNKVMNDPLTYVWSHDDKYACMKASAFVSGTNYESESWLISPVIDLTSKTEAYLTFEHATNFFNVEGSVEDEATVWAKKDGDSEWTKLSGITYPSSQGWTFVDAGDINLSAFTGTKMQFAFVYKSSSSQSGTWEIKNVVVKNHIEAYCEVTPLALNVSAEAGTTTFNITSNEYWLIVSNNQAYTVSPEEGTGNATITVTYPANESEEPVEVSFTVLSDSGIENTVTLTQRSATSEESALATLVTSESEIVPGKYIILGEFSEGVYALPNKKSSSSAPVEVAIGSTQIVEGNGVLTAIDDNYVWQFTSSGNGFTINPSGDSSIGLGCTNANNGLRNSSSYADVVWTFATTSAKSGWEISSFDTQNNQRWICGYEPTNWRTYKNATTNANCTFRIYKLSE